MKILISRCLLGEPCRYDGASRPVEGLAELERCGYTLIPICPETAGGLSTPRSPAERQADGTVINYAGEDVTEAYRSGAEYAVELALREECQIAVLKAKSPSCGSGQIYDGTFSGRLIPGWGVAAERLQEAGIPVLDESNWRELLAR